MAERRAREGRWRLVLAAALACSAAAHAGLLLGLRLPRDSPGRLPGSPPAAEGERLPRRLTLLDLPTAREPAPVPSEPEEAPAPDTASAPAAPPAADARGAAAASPQASPASAAEALRPGYRDPRLYVRPREAGTRRRSLAPHELLRERLEEGVFASHDSVRAEQRRKAERSRVRILGLEIPLFGSADDFVDIDPQWVAIRAQEEARRRAELIEERDRAARERRARERERKRPRGSG